MTQHSNILSFDEARVRGTRSRGAHDPSRFSSATTHRRSSLDPEGRFAGYGAHSATRPSFREASGTRGASSRRAASTRPVRESERDFGGRRSARGERSDASRRAEREEARSAVPSRRERMARKVRSAKAERQFERTIGRQDAARAQAEAGQERSRAAVYEMRMGRNHKRSSRMQDRGVSAPSFDLGGIGSVIAGIAQGPLWMRAIAISLVSLLVVVLFLYQPVASYYNEVRSLQQLEVEYELVSEYYDQVKAEAEMFSSEEGLAEYAHEQLGWIRPSEHSVNVDGLSEEVAKKDSSATLALNTLDSKSIKAPDTWYSGVLDMVFGYGG